MDEKDNIQPDVAEGNADSKFFIFSTPSTIFKPPKVTNSGIESEYVSDISSKNNLFTFAAPTIISHYNEGNTNWQASNLDTYKPKISRTSYKPTVNVFANALKNTVAFEQLKKNSRTCNTKTNINNSLTYFNVPKALLTKTAAKEYFMEFGNIVKITIRPKRQMITVVYASKAEANVAYHKSGNYLGEKFHIEWTKSETLTKSPTKKKDLHKNIVANLLKASDDEIKSELEAMTNLEYNLHTDIGTEISDKNILVPRKSRGGKTILQYDKPISKTEKTIAKVEKIEATESQCNTSIEELQNIIHQVALTTEDKYKVLEARDRLMRLKRIKPHTLATAKVTSGTCPDMCPEKERLMRESQRQVAMYEQLDGNEYRINHITAIKQYSRSSADQEEPMPHELRPVKSLKMTMSYLLHEIVDLCEQENTNLAEWYHFLWDRTRGIRKDITQQELCCKDSVELIEQCARFHIVCSERLCAEETSVFDKKINSENLTKCLQTLKYMYHDLRIKGIICENEPEFRAYIILLNLNNGNFMWDLQQLPKSIQSSPNIQFAINVYFALDSNNYYKFFKLVQQTTYLNACILLRYFNQVRVKALLVMVKTYCRTATTSFPLYDLMDILSFEDENEAKYFCEQVGLYLSNDELFVLLNRQNFNMPTTNIQQGRACNLIASKRIRLKFSIGQCIAGKKMPDKTYKNHKPHNSFDTYGNLMPESIDASDQNLNISYAELDPYDFTEKEPKKMPKLAWIHNKNQPSVSMVVTSAEIKKQSTNINNEAHKYKSVPISEPKNTNVFKTVTSEENITSGYKLKMPNVFDIKSLSNTQLKAVSNKNSDNDNMIINTTHHENALNNTTQFAIFGSSTTESNPFINKSTMFSMQSETSHMAEVPTSFAMATNKSIFSGAGSENIFMKNITASSTVFTNKNSPILNSQLSTQQSVSGTNVFKVQEQSISPKKGHTKKNEEIVLKTEKAKLEKLEHAKKMHQIEEYSAEIYNELYTETISEFCSIIVKEDIDTIKMYDTLSEKISFGIISEITHEICDAVVTADITNQKKLYDMLQRIKNRVIIKCFNAWKQYVSKRKRQRVALEDTPVWLQRQSVEECAKMLYSKEQKLVMQNMQKKQQESKDVIVNTETFAPIEVIAYAGIKENLKLLDIHSPTFNVFWKLVISWPDLSNKTVLWHHKKIMNEYLCPSNFTMEPIIKIYRPNSFETLHVCVRHFEGLTSEHNLVGVDAFLFIVDGAEEYKSVSKRLIKTVMSKQKLMPIPLVLMVLNDGKLQDQNGGIILDLESLLESGYISEYTTMFEKDLTAEIILNLTQSSILWLTMNKSPSNPLEMDYLHNVYDICLSEELWLRILDDSMFNKQLSNALKNPNFIINLHNEAISHLMEIILDPESMLYTNFAPEFKKFLKTNYTMPCSYEYFDESWKRNEYRARLETSINSFILPPWTAPWPVTDTQILRRHISYYCKEVLSDSDYNIIFCDILSNLFLISGTLQVTSFMNILLHVLKEKIRFLDKNQMVVYNKNHIKHFRTLPWWFKSNVLTRFMSQESYVDNNESLNRSSRKKRKLDRSQNDLEDMSLLDHEFNPLAKFCENTRDRIMEIYSASKDIENRLQTQQLESMLLQEKLKDALVDEDLMDENI